MKKKCPQCWSRDTKKYGHEKRWKKGVSYRVQKYRCNNCGKQFD